MCVCVNVCFPRESLSLPSLQTASLSVGISLSSDLHALSHRTACGDVMGGVPFLYERSSVISGGDQLAEQSTRPVLLCE